MNNQLPNLEHTVIFNNRKSNLVYWIILVFIILAIAALPFVKVNIAVTSQGIVRPVHEKTSIKSTEPGIVRLLNVKNGDTVRANDVLLEIRNDQNSQGLVTVNSELAKKYILEHDLNLLCTNLLITKNLVERLQSDLFRSQASHFLHLSEVQQATVSKADYELSSAKLLFKDSVISAKEFFNQANESQKAAANREAFLTDQQSNWAREMINLRSEILTLENQKQSLEEAQAKFLIRAPVDGVLIGLQGMYEGSSIQAGETLCELSPESMLIAECLVSTKDIGLLKKERPVIFQVDAFDHNYFGTLSGKIISIDNDYSLLNDAPGYKVRCSFDAKTLKLKNGYSVNLKKGLTLRARFQVTERTLLQLMFDRMDDWFNPTSA